MVRLDKDKVLGIVTAQGGINSHMAILAGALGIPTIVSANIQVEELRSKEWGILDAGAGELIIEPDDELIMSYEDKVREQLEIKRELDEMKGQRTVTKTGREIMLYANANSLEDVDKAIENDAAGIGLFRSEFLFLNREKMPTEQEQFEIYRQAALKMKDKPVYIRTLDIGSDKKCAYIDFTIEENPALGCRGIRLCLENPQMFKAQLRALFRASYYGNIGIIYPMVSSLKEIKKIKDIVKVVKAELDEKGLKYGEPKQGIMIETPASVWLSQEFAREVDFFSIGSNNLEQFTQGRDRNDSRLWEMCDEGHIELLRQIQMVVDNAHKAGIWAGICGEIAGDTAFTEQLLETGLDELSVNPGKILETKKMIRG